MFGSGISSMKSMRPSDGAENLPPPRRLLQAGEPHPLSVGCLVESKLPSATIAGGLAFEPGMIGVADFLYSDGSAQIEFYHPKTGRLEHAFVASPQLVEFPDSMQLAASLGAKQSSDEKMSLTGERWSNLGTLTWRGAVRLLQAAAILRPEYLKQLHPETIRLPEVHTRRERESLDDQPDHDTVLASTRNLAQSYLRTLAANLEWISEKAEDYKLNLGDPLMLHEISMPDAVDVRAEVEAQRG